MFATTCYMTQPVMAISVPDNGRNPSPPTRLFLSESKLRSDFQLYSTHTRLPPLPGSLRLLNKLTVSIVVFSYLYRYIIIITYSLCQAFIRNPHDFLQQFSHQRWRGVIYACISFIRAIFVELTCYDFLQLYL